MAGVIACSVIGNVWSHVEQQRKDAAKVEMSVEQSLGRTRSVHVSVEVKDGATWDTARGDSQMLIHIVGRTLKGQTIDEYQYVNSAGDGIELKPGDYELTVDEPPVATDGTRFRASKRMVPVNFNSQRPTRSTLHRRRVRPLRGYPVGTRRSFRYGYSIIACRPVPPPRVGQ